VVISGKRAIWSGVGLGFGSNYTDISLAPSAIYNFNEYVALGLGAQYTYLKQKKITMLPISMVAVL
jgi:hypothetical protein